LAKKVGNGKPFSTFFFFCDLRCGWPQALACVIAGRFFDSDCLNFHVGQASQMPDNSLSMNAPSKDPQIESLKVPPHSIEAEQSVLGGLLLDNALGTALPISSARERFLSLRPPDHLPAHRR
jgi:hypothetical protein